MKICDILGFLLGKESAIRTVAASHSALPVGLIFVLLAGIAREYDQTWLGDNWLRFFAPVLTSFIAAALIYFLLTLVLPDERTDDAKGQRLPRGGFLRFLALFWMTGPFAWIYAFPAEHVFPPREAAWINISLLGFVATARVLLLSRILSVLMKLSFLRVFMSVLLVTAPWMAVGSAMTSLSLMRLMGGLRYSPEESVLASASGTVFLASICIGVIALVACASMAARKRLTREPLPIPVLTGAPWPVISVLAVAFLGSLSLTQERLKNSAQAAQLLHKGNYAGFIAYLSARQPADFSPVKRLPPDVYEYHGLLHLSPLIHTLNGSEAPWVRKKCFNDLRDALGHDYYALRMYARKALLALEHVLSIPGGKECVLANAKLLEPHFREPYYDDPPELARITKILNELGLNVYTPPPAPEAPAP